MAISFRQGEGARTAGTGTRTIASITAGLVVVNTGDVVGSAVGDIMEIFGSSTAANNGFYTLTVINTAPTPDTYQLRPAPVNQAASGSISRLTRAAAKTVSGTTNITSVTALPGGLAAVEVAGANFLTNLVDISDRFILVGSGTAANNGGWYISEVVSESVVIVRPPDGGTGMTTEAVGTGTCSVRHGVHVMAITNEVALSWSQVLSVAAPLNGPSGGSPFFGSGTIRDYVRRRSVGGDNSTAPLTRTLFSLHGLDQISVDQSGLGTPSAWTSVNELVINRRSGSPSPGGSLLRFSATGSWGAGNILTFTLGTQAGNRYSAQDGSVWCGIGFLNAGFTGTQRLRVSAYGSYLDGVATQCLVGPLGNLTADILRPGVSINSGVVESTIIYGVVSLVTQAAGDQANVLVTQQTSGSSIADASTITGLLLSDQVLVPGFNNISSALVIILDPRTDLDLTVNFNNLIGASTFEKRYTFNPRFVTVSTAGAQPAAINSLRVRLFEINEATGAETAVFSGLTNSSGQLASGAGVQLRRQLLDNVNTSTLFSHRMVLEGAGLRMVNLRIQLRSRVDTDFALLRIAPDYEGEYSE